MSKQPAIKQPKFDHRIKTLAFPLEDKNLGTLTRGYMTWDKPQPGFSDNARVDFLYNPSSVTATFNMSTAGPTIQFPNAGDTADPRVQLNQTASWSLLFDRTYELWGQYKPDGTPIQSPGPNNNNPAVYGVLADLYQLQQFTGMTMAYSPDGQLGHKLSTTSLIGRQGILQLIPSYVYFGGKKNLAYYGYVTEWDYTITHWTQYMIPMRCLVDISWTMLPPIGNQTTVTGGPGFPPGLKRKITPGANISPNVIPGIPPQTSNAGISGR